MAAVQKTKVRPILNLSAPKGCSFNDAVDPLSIDKLKMSSAKLFAEAVIKAGQGAIMAKTNILAKNSIEITRFQVDEQIFL